MSAPPRLDAAALVTAHVLERLGLREGAPLLVGLCGAQGSGKSTLAAEVAAGLDGRGVRAAVLSLDDLYLDRAARAALAERQHPLLLTRGPPGTHDVDLGLAILDRFRRGGALLLPRFDKAMDAPRPREAWESVAPGLEVLLFEGWCVGARPQTAHALEPPINALERTRDPDGGWRGFVNGALAGPYQRLFAGLDSLVMLAAPGFEVVPGWRAEQERALATAGPGAGGLMSTDELAVFVQHFERLTRHMLAETPARADLVLRLDERRNVLVQSEPVTP